MTGFRFLPLLALGLAVAACRPSYSPDDYATRAVQQMNRVEQGVIIGSRRVTVTAEGTTGAATGAAAGGIVGNQASGGNMIGAIGAVGGALVGGLMGTATERVVGNTFAYEYIVRKANNEMYTVTQQDQTPLPLGSRVLLIAGNQARIVLDYTAPGDPPPTSLPATPPAAPATGAAPATPAAATPPAGTAQPAPAAVPAEALPPITPPAGATPARPAADPIL